MANETAKRDVNHIPVGTGVTNDSSQEIKQFRVDPTSGGLVVDLSYITKVYDNRKVVTAAGSAESLSLTSTSCKEIIIMAENDNTGYITVGSTTVIASAATRRGIPLSAGQAIGPIKCDDLQDICIDATVSGEGITFIYFV